MKKLWEYPVDSVESCKGKKFHHIAYPCIICDKDFSTQPEHKQHMKIHSIPKATLPKNFNCHICEKMLSSKQKLNQHIESMHKIKTASGFILMENKINHSSTICHKQFRDSFNLHRHQVDVPNF